MPKLLGILFVVNIVLLAANMILGSPIGVIMHSAVIVFLLSILILEEKD